ncbi:MAG: tripartite tricarboxylate transporter permease [Firmicutes bacterium]|jgi:putative tricarboxylic transport membrane protein|nr:tripartite tricarboxylate transporter permease [Bacillota bacterium]
MTLIMVLYAIVGTALGLFMGALPGITVTMTAVLVVSLTYGWPMMEALAFIVGAFCGGVTGGCISAIALNIPGTSAAVATSFDGYPLLKRGEADNALSIGLATSFMGGLIGLLIMLAAGPAIGSFALKFGSQEYFLITMWGLTLVAVLSRGNTVKGLAAAFFGLFVGMIGMDPVMGMLRFTFGTGILKGGINFVAAMIGLFGMKEVIKQLSKTESFNITGTVYNIKGLLPKPHLLKKVWHTVLWGGPLGTLIGLLPGTGGDVGCIVAYGVAKQVTRNPSRPFGEGAYEGVAAPEVANNAAIGGALTTMMTLGIPGDSVTAVILGSFYLHGLLPGPTFMLTEKHYFYVIVWCVLVGTIMAYVFGILGSNLILKAINLPKWLLVPFITILCIVGSYAISNNLYDVMIMMVFGIIGYLFEKGGFPTGPIVLAVILGPMIERNLRQALVLTGGFFPFLSSLVTRPISIVLLILMVVSFVLQSKVMSAANNRSKAA